MLFAELIFRHIDDPAAEHPADEHRVTQAAAIPSHLFTCTSVMPLQCGAAGFPAHPQIDRCDLSAA